MIDWQTEWDKWRRDVRVPLVGTFFFGACLIIAIAALLSVFFAKTPTIAITPAPITTPLIDVSQLHVFGMYNAAVGNLPVATTSLKLQGTVVIKDTPSRSQALITSLGQPTQAYHVGDVLPGNMKITLISEDYIVIDNNGSLEKLPLPIETVNGVHLP